MNWTEKRPVVPRSVDSLIRCFAERMYAMREQNALLRVRDLRKHFPITRGFFNTVVGQVKAVDGVSFDLFEGECLGLVGESGSGKTTVGRTILRAIAPTAGEVWFRKDSEEVDVAQAPHDVLKSLRRDMQMIFQDPLCLLESAYDGARYYW